MKFRWVWGALIILILVGTMIKAEPSGSSLDRGPSSRGVSPNPLTTDAQAGNITGLNIDQTRITDIWQGFFGNVSGQIVLENAAGSNFYDWTYSSMEGEIYATRNTVSDWSLINCTNSTHWSNEETGLGILPSTVDGINETYSQFNHPAFQVGGRTMNGCPSTRPYNSTSTASTFWNVLLNSNPTNVVYTAILSENQKAFDNSTVDFEILVPVNRTVGTSTYYFYVELN